MNKTTETAVLPNPRRRQLLIGGTALAVVIAAGGGYYAWRASSSPQPKATLAAEPPGGADVSMAELMIPGPLGDNALGSPNAPVTIVEYASMTCPHCAHFHETTYPELKKKYIDTGKVRFIFREFPLDALAAAGSMLARCAGRDKYFPMIETLFAQQREWVVQKPLEPMLGIARQAGFTQQSFDECLANQEMLAGIEETRTRAMKLGVNSTPTFFINGKIFRGGLTSEELDRQIAPYLKA
jgi:protein-disulfide isomerase